MSVRKLFEEELDSLKRELVEMCRITETMIENAVKALTEKNISFANAVSESDKQVDDYELDIEKKCMRILLRQQPVAKDLREISAAMKMITDIERIGDQASDIADIIATSPDIENWNEPDEIKKMGEIVVKMVHNSVNSFIMNDEELAEETEKLDDDVDLLFLNVKNKLVELIKRKSDNADSSITFMMIAKYLERIGDHAVNVCEWTNFNETGVRKKYQ